MPEVCLNATQIKSRMTPRKRLLLMRHGSVEYFDDKGRAYPPEDVPLTETGRQEAEAAGRALATQAIDRVITSGLVRTRMTAEIALAAAGLAPPVEHWHELGEIRGGRIGELSPAEFATGLTAAFSGPVDLATRFLGGESVGELLDRTVPAIERLLADPDWDCALLVLHGGVNRGLLSWFLTGERRFLGGLEQDPGCINVIDVGQGPADAIVRTTNFRPAQTVSAGARLSTLEHLLLDYQARLGQPR